MVFNEDSADVDFRIESNGNENTFFVDGGNDRIGIKTNAPTTELNIGEGRLHIVYTGADTTDGINSVLRVDASGSTITNNAAMTLRVPSTGSRKGFQIGNGTDAYSWCSFEWGAGGTNKPGFTLGPGGASSRDTNIYRDSANVLKTDDSLIIGDALTAVAVYSDTVGVTNRDLYIDNTGIIGYVSSSLKYKTNIRDFNDTSFLYQLKPKIYDRTNGAKDEVGLIAEDVDKVYPKIVSYRRGEKVVGTGIFEEDGTERTKIEYYETDEPETVNYSRLITPLLAEVQKLNERVIELEKKVEALEKKK
jgi:hypothetical protein